MPTPECVGFALWLSLARAVWHRRTLMVLLVALLAGVVRPLAAQTPPPPVRINQIYGGGGNSGAIWKSGSVL